MRPRAIPFAVGAWLFLVGVVVQVFLAGMGLFELSDWTNHTNLGWGLGMLVLLVPVLALIAGAERRTIAIASLLMVAGMIQPELAYARRENPVMAALHPVNALLVFWLSLQVARASIRELRPAASPRRTSDATSPNADDARVGQDAAASPSTTV